MTIEDLKPIFEGLRRNILTLPTDEIYYRCNPLKILIQSPGWSYGGRGGGRSRMQRAYSYLLACNIPYEAISIAGYSSESLDLTKYPYVKNESK